MSGIEELRRAVTLFGNCTESFNTRFSAEQLLKIYRGYVASDWDICPDRWSDEQLDAWLERGVVPTFSLVDGLRAGR